MIDGGVSADIPILPAEALGATVTYVLPAPPSHATNPIDFRETTRLIDEGYRLASDWTAAHLPATGTGLATVSAAPGRRAHPMAISAV